MPEKKKAPHLIKPWSHPRAERSRPLQLDRRFSYPAAAPWQSDHLLGEQKVVRAQLQFLTTSPAKDSPMEHAVKEEPRMKTSTSPRPLMQQLWRAMREDPAILLGL